MKKKTTKEIHKVLKTLIKLHLLQRLEEIDVVSAKIKALNKIEKADVSKKVRLALFGILPDAMAEIQRMTLDSDVIKMKKYIAEDNITVKEFVRDLKIGSNDTIGIIGRIKKYGVSKGIMEALGDEAELDYSQKEVGQRVTIPHVLFTNMLVTSEGAQMPSPSFLVPAAPELANQEAIVVEINRDDVYYYCGVCEGKHKADVRIAFKDYNMEFYISNDLLKVVPDVTTKE